jgi:chromate transport protein ChrA
MGAGCRAEFWRTGRPDSRDAQDTGGRKNWISETRFLHALNYCTLVPGPEAHKLAVYIGWLLHRTRGGLAAGILFILPGLLALGTLSWIYASYGQIGIVQALFFGLKAAVLAVVLEAVMRVGRRALKARPWWVLPSCHLSRYLCLPSLFRSLLRQLR